jgi:hypothetical protein
MKKLFFASVMVAFLFSVSCKSKADDKKTDDKTLVKSDGKTDVKETGETPVKEEGGMTGAADGKMGELAADICNCMSMVEKDMSDETKQLIIDASGEADPTAAMQKAIMALPNDKKMSIGTEMMKMGAMSDKTKGAGLCMKQLEEKYSDIKSMDTDKAILLKVVGALENANCPFALAVMKLGVKEMEKRNSPPSVPNAN